MLLGRFFWRLFLRRDGCVLDDVLECDGFQGSGDISIVEANLFGHDLKQKKDDTQAGDEALLPKTMGLAYVFVCVQSRWTFLGRLVLFRPSLFWWSPGQVTVFFLRWWFLTVPGVIRAKARVFA